jgi:hypothetical protein
VKIKNVQLKTVGEWVILSADCKIRRVGWDKVYFKFDKKYKNFIVADASPFAAALLVTAMGQGRDLYIDGSISQKLNEGLVSIIGRMSGNFGLHRIKVHAREVTKDDFGANLTASYFSGGVDSFYTYLKHRHGPNKISHFVLIRGFDIDLRNHITWNAALKNVSKIAAAEGIELIKVESNLYSLTDPIVSWDYTYGGSLAAVSLSLRNKLRLSYIPSAYSLDQQRLDGSTFELDPLWGTETLQFVHDGVEAKRVEKVIKISSNKLALQNLRVCYENPNGTYNCGKCDKCIRTMVSLKISGALDKARTFPKIIDKQALNNLEVNEYHQVFHRENLAELKRLTIEPDIQEALEDYLQKASEARKNDKDLIKKAIYLDHIYTKGLARRAAAPVFGRKF